MISRPCKEASGGGASPIVQNKEGARAPIWHKADTAHTPHEAAVERLVGDGYRRSGFYAGLRTIGVCSWLYDMDGRHIPEPEALAEAIMSSKREATMLRCASALQKRNGVSSIRFERRRQTYMRNNGHMVCSGWGVIPDAWRVTAGEAGLLLVEAVEVVHTNPLTLQKRLLYDELADLVDDQNVDFRLVVMAA